MMNCRKACRRPALTGPLHPIHHSSFIIRDSEDHSSFVPYASSLLGGVALSYSIAALMLGIGILAAWTWKAPGIPADPLAGLSTVEVVKNAAPRGGPSSVGRITRMRDCEWLNADIGSRNVLDVVIGSKYIVHAGRMEITYASGVKVVLNGPAVYEVDGRNSGSLRLGSVAFSARAARREAESTGRKGSTGRNRRRRARRRAVLLRSRFSRRLAAGYGAAARRESHPVG